MTQNKGDPVPTLVLASASVTRRQMLENAGIPFETLPVRIDEEAIRASMEAEGATPRDVADALGEFKARKGQEKRPDALVLGSDQVLALKGRVHGKPASREDAAAQLLLLQGQTHMLLSSAVIYHEGAPIWRAIGQVRLTMHPLSEAQIEAYLDRVWPDVSGSVGAYHAEGYGARLFSRIEGDWFSVLGLPLLEVCSFLRLRGWLD
jgi:septum formation protein